MASASSSSNGGGGGKAEDSVMEGYVTKSPPPGIMKGWKRRWMRLKHAVRLS